MSSWDSTSYLYRPPISHPYVPPGPHARFSRMELEHLTIAYCVLAGCLTLLIVRDDFLEYGAVDRIGAIAALAAGLLAAGTGFVAHEMAHKFVAQARGLWAEFRMSPQGLLMSVTFSLLLGVLFATPGATMIGGRGTLEEAGVTSIAGPATNFLEALGFVAVYLWLIRWGQYFWAPLFGWVAFINLVFAVFNLIPLGPLDGKKVLAWNKLVWGASFVGALATGVVAYLYVGTYVPY